MQFIKRIYRKRRSGFTLVEMTIVLIIIVLLLLLVIPNAANQRKHAEATTSEAFKSMVHTQGDLYANEHDDQRPTLQQLETDGYLSPKQVAKAQSAGIQP